MQKVALALFDKTSRRFEHLRDIDLLVIPSKGDLLFIEYDGEEQVFDVHRVRHWERKDIIQIDIMLRSTSEEYENSRFLDLYARVR